MYIAAANKRAVIIAAAPEAGSIIMRAECRNAKIAISAAAGIGVANESRQCA